MPNLSLWRPCDAVETAVAWKACIERNRGPSCLVLTRQAVPQQTRSATQLEVIPRGGYTLLDCAGLPEVIVIASGSELSLCVAGVQAANERGRRVRLVSMPSTDTFDQQSATWRESVLPAAVARRIAVEAAATQSWWKYVGLQGLVLGLDRFGASGSAPQLFRHFGLTSEAVARAVDQLLAAS